MRDDTNNNGHKGMWWMMLPCLLLLGFLFFSGGGLSSSGYFLPILIGVFVVAHIWMMFRGHGVSSENDKDDMETSGKPDAKDNQRPSGSCH